MHLSKQNLFCLQCCKKFCKKHRLLDFQISKDLCAIASMCFVLKTALNGCPEYVYSTDASLPPVCIDNITKQTRYFGIVNFFFT